MEKGGKKKGKKLEQLDDVDDDGPKKFEIIHSSPPREAKYEKDTCTNDSDQQSFRCVQKSESPIFFVNNYTTDDFNELGENTPEFEIFDGDGDDDDYIPIPGSTSSSSPPRTPDTISVSVSDEETFEEHESGRGWMIFSAAATVIVSVLVCCLLCKEPRTSRP